MNSKNTNNNNNVFVWSPMLSHVGTINATIGMANSIKKYNSGLNYKIFLLNVFGEFNFLHKNENFRVLNIFSMFKFPKTGFISKFAIYLFTVISFPYLIYLVKKHKPKIIITCLVGYLPCFLKIFFKDIKVINSIQGLPKLNYLRKILWKITYKNSDCLICMTDSTKSFLIKSLNLNEKKVIKINNPIISREIKLLSTQDVDDEDVFIFKKKVFCSIGRLTRQKNYIELIKTFENFNKKNFQKYNLIILGEGEQEHMLKNFLKQNKIKNCFLLGFKKNPYRYLSKSSLYISSSLWEEPGHTLIEAGYLNVPIVSSNCPNGPKELINDNFNGFKYELKNVKEFEDKIFQAINLQNKDLLKIKLNMKKLCSDFTQFKFSQKLKKFI